MNKTKETDILLVQYKNSIKKQQQRAIYEKIQKQGIIFARSK